MGQKTLPWGFLYNWVDDLEGAFYIEIRTTVFSHCSIDPSQLVYRVTVLGGQGLAGGIGTGILK